MLLNRLLSSLVFISIVLFAVFNSLVFKVAVIAIIILGLYEFFTMLENKGIRIYKYFGIGLGIVIPLSILFRFELTKRWELLFIVLTLLFLIMMQFKRRNTSGVIVDISTTLFGIMYVSWLFSFLIKIRSLSGGVALLGALLLITKLCDIGAYLIGSRFGRIPLMPRISPKKSVEGGAGGLLFSILGAMACQPFLRFTYSHLVLLGLAIGVLAQLGDLSESLLKRDCGVKDSGGLLPGLGGILDSIDSVLFTAPVFYFYISTICR